MLVLDDIGELTARIDLKHLVSIDLAYKCDNVSYTASHGKKDGVGILQNEHYSHKKLIGFFGCQLRGKSRTDRKRMLSADFSEKWVQVTCLGGVNRVNRNFLF